MIILFDVDGVLVENLAYRASIQFTTAYFAERLGLQVEPPTNLDIDVFEAESITVEWDTCSLIATVLLLARLKAEIEAGRAASIPRVPSFWAALEQLPPTHPIPLPTPDYAGLARRVGAAARQTGHLPARAALGLFTQDLRQAGAPLAELAQPLLVDLLGSVYSIDDSPGMQVFQNYALGHESYARYYKLPPRVTGEALLERLDRPLLEPALAAQLLERKAGGQVHPVVFTARPSLAPGGENATPRGYTPESEIAARQVGLAALPVMGYGKLNWLAVRVGLKGSDLVKPSPAHAMAAMAAAVTGGEVEALKAALAVERGDHLRYPLTACAGQTVHVFEDSPSSLGGAAQAVAHLNRQGLALHVVLHGIAPARSPKAATLAEAADAVHEDVNAGLREILGV
jgi:hypothetical protein